MTDSGVALSGGGSASSSTGAFGDGPDRRARVLSHMRVSIVVSMTESSASAVALGAIYHHHQHRHHKQSQLCKKIASMPMDV